MAHGGHGKATSVGAETGEIGDGGRLHELAAIYLEAQKLEAEILDAQSRHTALLDEMKAAGIPMHEIGEAADDLLARMPADARN